jgi:hypothetical protein
MGVSKFRILEIRVRLDQRFEEIWGIRVRS